MTALFDRSWCERLREGDTEAALQLARDILHPLYHYCQGQLADRRVSQQVVRSTLIRAIREVEDYDPETHHNQILDWVFALTAPELERLGSSQDTPRNGAKETDLEADAESSPDASFIYRVETDLCLEVRRSRDSSDEHVRRMEYVARRSEVAIACPACGQAYQISRTRLGHRVRCGHCDRTFEASSDAAQDHCDEHEEVCGWYVKRESEVSGPFTTAELREKIAVGEISPVEFVRQGEQGAWKPAVAAEGLFSPTPSPDCGGSELPVSVVAPPMPEIQPERSRAVRKVPKKIARFEIREHLGSGSFGDVFRAYDPVLDRELAIKVATSAALDDDRARPYVLQEPKAAAQLRHPNIVAVHDAGFDGHRFYVAIDLIHGCTLRERLQRDPLNRDEAVRLVLSLAEALDYAHRSSVLHRDVKPSNIMIDAHGQALLMDFGLAQIEHSTGERTEHEAGFLGTPGYMPPEQISRSYGDIGPHSDQYSLGVVLYELLAGQPPFVGPDSVLVVNTLHIEPPRPRTHDVTIDRDLEAICLRTLAKKPADRYGSCLALAEDLRRYQEGLPTTARPLRLPERFRRWLRRERPLSTALATSGALLLLFVVALAATAAVLARMYEEKKDAKDREQQARVEAETSRDEAEIARDAARKSQQQAEASRDKARSAQQQAVANLAMTYFRHGHTLCDNGQIPEGLTYLVESLGLAESVQEGTTQARSLASLIRMSLSTWRRQLHDLQAMLPHRLDEQDRPVHCVAVDPTGHFMVTASHNEDGAAVWFWDVAGKTPTRLQNPIRTSEAIEAIAFTHDGKICASVGNVADLGCVIRMWRYSERDTKWQMGDAWPTEARARYRAIEFSPDGTYLVAAGQDGTTGIVREWRVDTRSLVHTYYQGPAIPQCVAYGSPAYAPNGRRLAIGMNISGTGGATIAVYRAAGEAIWTNEFDGSVYDVAFSHDGKLLAAAVGATLKGEARLWTAATGIPVEDRLTHLNQVCAVEFSPDDKFILTGSQDRSARLWDRMSGRLLGHPLWHVHEVKDVVFVPRASTDGDRPLRVVSVGDNVACLWNVAMGTPASADRIGPTVLSGAKIPGREPEQIVTVGTRSHSAGKTRILKTSDFPVKEVLTLPNELPATCVAAGIGWGIVGLADGRVYRAKWAAGELQLLAERHSGSVLCAAVSRDARFGATAGEDGQVLVWRMMTGALTTSMKCEEAGSVNALAFDPANEHVVLTGGADGQLRFWNGETGESIGRRLPHAAAVLCAAYSDDGLTLAVGLVGGGQIWQRDSVDEQWRRGARLETETGILRIHIGPLRDIVATGDFLGNVRFWHLATGEPIGPPLANQGMVTVLIGSDKDVLSGTSSGSLRRWPLPATTSASQEQLKLWVESITGLRLGQEQNIERLGVERWNVAGDGEIDREYEEERERYSHSVPRLDRDIDELPVHRLPLQDMLRAYLTESPTFHPPSLEYLDRYLPNDTEALIGLDVRQLIAAPLTWFIGMSRFDLLSWSQLTMALKEWSDVSGFHPLLDVHYVLLAASRHSISSSSPPALTVVVKGDFDFEQLRAMARDYAERAPGVAQLLRGTAGRPIFQLKVPPPFGKNVDFCVFAALIEDEDDGTLIVSLSQETVKRALVAATTDRLDNDFRTCLENVDRQGSLWFVARKESLEPTLLELATSLSTPSVIPEQMEGALTVFTQVNLTVRATYRDSETAKFAAFALRMLWIYGEIPIGDLRQINLETTVEGTQLVVRGDNLRLAAHKGQTIPPTPPPPPPPERSREEEARKELDKIEDKIDKMKVLGWQNVYDELGTFLKKYSFPEVEVFESAKKLRDQAKSEAEAQRELQLAKLNLRRGLMDRAIRLFEKIVKEHPGTEAAIEAGNELKRMKGVVRQ